MGWVSAFSRAALTALVAGCGSEPDRTLDTRAVVIGIDSADWRIIDALAEMPDTTRTMPTD